MFEEYLRKQLESSPLYVSKSKTNNESYKGIQRLVYPKWEGWKVIKEERAKGVKIHAIRSKKLDDLVWSLYYMRYLEESIS